MLYYSMLPCHKTHSSSSSLLLAPSLPLCFCLAHAVEDVFLTSASPFSSTEKAARVQFQIGQDTVVKQFEKWMFQWHHSCLHPVLFSFFFYVCLWTCEISEAAENFITLSLLLNSVKHHRYSILNLALEGTGLGSGWYNVHSHPSSTVHGELWLPLIRKMYGGLA